MLEKTELFANLASDTLDALRQRVSGRRLVRGELLFSIGDPPDHIYIVEQGRVRVWAVSASGTEVTLNVLGVGAVFGEIAMLDGSERTASVSALDEAELIVIPKAAFDRALDADSRLARNVIALLCDRLRWVSQRMEDSALRTAPERLARLLTFFCEDHGQQTPNGIRLALNLTQSELARWSLMSRENLNKTLNRWAEEGFVTQARGEIIVHDLARIEDIAELGDNH